MKKSLIHKNCIVNSILYLVIAVLLIVGPMSLFKVCEVKDMPMKCYWSVRAILGIAIILIAISLAHLVAYSFREKILINGITIVLGIVLIAIPAKLIGGCNMEMMPCRSVAFPTIYILSVVLIIAAVVENIITIIKERKKLKDEE